MPEAKFWACYSRAGDMLLAGSAYAISTRYQHRQPEALKRQQHRPARMSGGRRASQRVLYHRLAGLIFPSASGDLARWHSKCALAAAYGEATDDTRRRFAHVLLAGLTPTRESATPPPAPRASYPPPPARAPTGHSAPTAWYRLGDYAYLALIYSEAGESPYDATS